jgi:hypothetical protein
LSLLALLVAPSRFIALIANTSKFLVSEVAYCPVPKVGIGGVACHLLKSPSRGAIFLRRD